MNVAIHNPKTDPTVAAHLTEATLLVSFYVLNIADEDGGQINIFFGPEKLAEFVTGLTAAAAAAAAAAPGEPKTLLEIRDELEIYLQ